MMAVHLTRRLTRSGAQAPGRSLLIELVCDGCPAISFLQCTFDDPSTLADEAYRLRFRCRDEGWDSGTVEIPGIGLSAVDFCGSCRQARTRPWMRRKESR